MNVRCATSIGFARVSSPRTYRRRAGRFSHQGFSVGPVLAAHHPASSPRPRPEQWKTTRRLVLPRLVSAEQAPGRRQQRAGEYEKRELVREQAVWATDGLLKPRPGRRQLLVWELKKAPGWPDAVAKPEREC